jgi:hypothetical protein
LQLPATPVFLLSRTILRSWFNVDFHLAVTPQNVVFYTIKSERYLIPAVILWLFELVILLLNACSLVKNPTAT